MLFGLKCSLLDVQIVTFSPVLGGNFKESPTKDTWVTDKWSHASFRILVKIDSDFFRFFKTEIFKVQSQVVIFLNGESKNQETWNLDRMGRIWVILSDCVYLRKIAILLIANSLDDDYNYTLRMKSTKSSPDKKKMYYRTNDFKFEIFSDVGYSFTMFEADSGTGFSKSYLCMCTFEMSTFFLDFIWPQISQVFWCIKKS